MQLYISVYFLVISLHNMLFYFLFVFVSQGINQLMVNSRVLSSVENLHVYEQEQNSW